MATPAPTPQDSAPYEDRRAFPRVPVAMPAFLQANGERHSVHLLDLSAGGALGICFDSELDVREITALIARSVALDALMKTRG